MLDLTVERSITVSEDVEVDLKGRKSMIFEKETDKKIIGEEDKEYYNYSNENEDDDRVVIVDDDDIMNIDENYGRVRNLKEVSMFKFC